MHYIMKQFLGLSAMMALLTSGLVFSEESASILEPSAQQAVQSAIEDGTQDATPQTVTTPAEIVEEALPEDGSEEVVEQVATPAPVTTTPAPANARFIWGLVATPAPPMVLAQVNLPQGSGLIVQQIKPEGPAAKAGVEAYDIILSVDGVAVSSLDVLTSEIQKAAGKPQKLTVLRRGKEMVLTITAEPAPAVQPFGAPFGVHPGPQLFIDPMNPTDDLDDDDCAPAFPGFQQFIERQRRQMESMRQRMEAMENAMRQGMPGFVPFAPGAAPAPAPNGGMMLIQPPTNDPNAQVQTDSFSVQVQKNGNEPALIKIKENGNEYQVDENSIDQLPENVRNRLNFNFKMNQP